MINGAQPCHLFWQVGSSATLGTGSVFAGNILALESISLNNGVTVLGRLLARNASVTLINDTVTRADCATGGTARRRRRRRRWRRAVAQAGAAHGVAKAVRGVGQQRRGPRADRRAPPREAAAPRGALHRQRLQGEDSGSTLGRDAQGQRLRRRQADQANHRASSSRSGSSVAACAPGATRSEWSRSIAEAGATSRARSFRRCDPAPLSPSFTG